MLLIIQKDQDRLKDLDLKEISYRTVIIADCQNLHHHLLHLGDLCGGHPARRVLHRHLRHLLPLL